MVVPFVLPVDDTEFAGLEAGEGIPVVFLHAGVCDSRMWAAQIAAVAEAGFWGVAYDRRGYGETTTVDEGFSHLEDLEIVLEDLGIHAAIFVGASLGGALAIDFALAYPERVAGLVLVATSISGAKVADLPPDIMQIANAMEAVEESGDLDAINAVDTHAWLDGPLSESGRVTGEVRALFQAMNGNILRKPELTREDRPPSVVDKVGEIDTPALLIVGDLDFPHIVARHEDLSEEMDNAFGAVIEGTAHLPGLERPDLFNPLLLEFLSMLTGTEEEEA
ncbi:MAG TPA: alpha/beta hydrolase [Pelagibacterium sp.]|uniref:alpha/beta fold hydrolase n=1 Tax=Pelagibacterium sp. TaxID=1967288 RepID=UPI002CEA840C|nr:alpha/beta hydrolase [Pelagibacterium sp.]HWJ87924.1 alpha/beta hydrolase [Pelagibacterium sp.]